MDKAIEQGAPQARFGLTFTALGVDLKGQLTVLVKGFETRHTAVPVGLNRQQTAAKSS